VEKYGIAGEATGKRYKAHEHCMLDNEGYRHTHTHTQNKKKILLFHVHNGYVDAPMLR
jgi:hypothetical protein